MLQHFQFFYILRLGTRELRLAIAHRYLRAGAGQRDSAFQRAVAATDDEHILAAEILRVVEPIVNLIEIFPRTAEPAMIAAPPDGHDALAALA